ncbi:unnamed protein product [Bemisia tabaci]|uniref:GOLD domain-containing protein n=1 Tax=Bemisia tabaci TaxID=7038 RepID=A0A9P0ACC0_BEMTA|nr:unnamed protein product [Bemisia tabaci]
MLSGVAPYTHLLRLFCLICSHLVLCGGVDEPLDFKLTFFVEAGKEECFFQEFAVNQNIDLEYQVLEGGQGELDINFKLITPSGQVIHHDYKQEENSYTFSVKEAGIHQFCWDNSISMFNRKTVFFEIYHENWSGESLQLTPEEEYDLKADNIADMLHQIQTHLLKIRHIQELFRASEARDRNLAERNFSRINNWSLFQITVMLFVGVCQVILVKGFLDEKSKVNNLWKSLLRLK